MYCSCIRHSYEKAFSEGPLFSTLCAGLLETYSLMDSYTLCTFPSVDYTPGLAPQPRLDNWMSSWDRGWAGGLPELQQRLSVEAAAWYRQLHGIGKTSETIVAESATWPMEVTDWLDKCMLPEPWGRGWAGGLPEPQQRLSIGPWIPSSGSWTWGKHYKHQMLPSSHVLMAT